ncbi:Protein NETWORKED 4B [Hirschfeldia incana]|nr:Protein NETWORKED 4B [Hirschfeldia incana]
MHNPIFFLLSHLICFVPLVSIKLKQIFKRHSSLLTLTDNLESSCRGFLRFSTPLKVMASSAPLSKKQFKRSTTKKSHSWWWDSHNCPKNSKWLAENLEKMDDRVKHMLKLIEEDADSFAKKAQMYYQKRPELIHLVEEFYRMYRALAERYDQASGELQKNHPPSGIQSQGSLDQSSPTSSRRHKQEEDSSSLTDSGSDSDSKSVDDHSSASDEDGDEALIRRMADLELELQETKQKLLLQQECVNGDNNNNTDLLQKITVYEGELKEANEKIRMQEEEIANLKAELQSCMSSGAETRESLELGKEETEDSAATKVHALEEQLSISKEKLQNFEKEISSLKNEVESSKAAEEKLQRVEHELKLAQNDADTLRNKLNAEKKEVLKLVERLAMVKTSLQDRDNEIRSLKTAVSDAEEKIFPEKAQIKGEMSKLVEERSQLGEQLRELESHVRLIREEKAGIEEKLKGESEKISVMKVESNVLRDEIGMREEKIKEMEKHMKELHMEHVRIRRRSSELSEEVERTRVAASEVAEQKREAIRQLCMSLEYYKDGYERLWNAVAGHKRGVVLAS